MWCLHSARQSSSAFYSFSLSQKGDLSSILRAFGAEHAQFQQSSPPPSACLQPEEQLHEQLHSMQEQYELKQQEVTILQAQVERLSTLLDSNQEVGPLQACRADLVHAMRMTCLIPTANLMMSPHWGPNCQHTRFSSNSEIIHISTNC